jgi:hypothetical protein
MRAMRPEPVWTGSKGSDTFATVGPRLESDHGC